MKNKKAKIAAIITGVVVCFIIFVLVVSASFDSVSVQAAEHLEKGYHYLEDMQYEQAVVEFTSVIEIDNRNVMAYSGCALAYSGMNDTESAVEILEDGYKQTESSFIANMAAAVANGENISEAIDVEPLKDKIKFSENVFDSLYLLKSPYYTWDFNAALDMFSFDYEAYAGQNLSLGTYSDYEIILDATTRNLEMYLVDSATEYGFKFIEDSELQIYRLKCLSEPSKMRGLSEVEFAFDMGVSQNAVLTAMELDQLLVEENTIYTFKSNCGLVSAVKWEDMEGTHIYINQIDNSDLGFEYIFENDALNEALYTCGLPNNIKSKVLNFFSDIMK